MSYIFGGNSGGSGGSGSTQGGFANSVGRNGGFEVWQRGTSIQDSSLGNFYTVDGWFLSVTAEVHTVSRQPGITLASQYAAQIQRSPGGSGVGINYFEFPLWTDELYKFRGQNATLIFSVAAGANWSPASGTLNYNVYCGTGAPSKRSATPYTGETNPISGSINLTPGGPAVPVVAASGAAIASNITQACVQFTWTETGTAGAADLFLLDDVDLRPTIEVTTPASFERSDYLWDLLRCSRFLPAFPLPGAALPGVIPVANGGWITGGPNSIAFGKIDYPVKTVIAPTGLLLSAASDFAVYDSATDTTVAITPGIGFGAGGLGNCYITAQTAASKTPGNFTSIVGVASTALMLFTGAEI